MSRGELTRADASKCSAAVSAASVGGVSPRLSGRSFASAHRHRDGAETRRRGRLRYHAAAWQKAFGGIRVPRGVYRFRTHQEADEWLWWMISSPKPAEPRANLRSGLIFRRQSKMRSSA